jgi:hypothetical protein
MVNWLQAHNLRNPYFVKDRRSVQPARSFFVSFQHKTFYIFTQGLALSSASLYKMHKTLDHTDPLLELSLYHIDTIQSSYTRCLDVYLYITKVGLNVGETTGRHPFPITYSQNPKRDSKVGQDPLIFASYGALFSTGCRSPKNGQI